MTLNPDWDWYRGFFAFSQFALDVYLLMLWSFIFGRTRLRLLWLLIISQAGFVLFAITFIVVVLFSDDTLRFDVFGIHGYSIFVHTSHVLQPLNAVLSAIGYTLVARCLLRSRSHPSAVAAKV